MWQFSNFLKTEIAKQKEVSTGYRLLDRAFGIPVGSFLLLKSESYAGATAIAISLSETLTKQGKLVVYCDVSNSIQYHKLHGIDLERFVILNPYYLSSTEFFSYIELICKQEEDAIIVFDNINFLEPDWKVTNVSNLAKRIRSVFPRTTIINTQRKGRVDPVWSFVVNISHEKNIYDDSLGESEWMGHIVNVEGPNGKSRAYIEYSTGRVSKAFEHVILEIESGKTSNSVFELDGIRAQGAYSFMHQYNRRLKNWNVV